VTSTSCSVDAFDESYVRHGQGYLQVRIYVPRGGGPFPTLLSVHGGAWNSGARDTNASLDKALAARGILVMAPDFRQPPLARYPVSVADVHLAARWARANAARFHGRPDRVGALGTSSGGHLLLLNALRPHDPRYSALPLEPPARLPPGPLLHHLALCWPIVDPLERYRWARRNGLHKLVLSHERYWGGEAAMTEGGPQQIIDRLSPYPGELPALLAVQGTADENIPAGATERFVAAYSAAGGQAGLHMYAGMPHGFITRDVRDRDSVAAIDLIACFVAHQSDNQADLSQQAPLT
jgi:acetyl esterase/lipase